jgi:hypothetical protein
MLELILLLTFVLPVAWLISEFQRHRWISIVLGCAATSMVGFVTYAWATFTTKFELNQSFGAASRSLVVAIVEELKTEDPDRVVSVLEDFAKQYDPNYENSPRYDEQIESVVERLRQE